MLKDIEILLKEYECLDYRFGNMLSCEVTNAIEHLLQAYKELKKHISFYEKNGSYKAKIFDLENKIEELELEKRMATIGKYNEIEIHELINKTLKQDYIPNSKIREILEDYQERKRYYDDNNIEKDKEYYRIEVYDNYDRAEEKKTTKKLKEEYER